MRISDNILDPGFVLRGQLTVQAKDRDGNILWEKDLGKNTIMPRSRLLGSRLFGQFMKAWSTNVFHSDWSAYAGQDYLGGADVGSYNYPFAEQLVGLGANVLDRLDVFGGVPVAQDTLIAGIPAVFQQNVSHAFHHGSAIPPGIDTALLYSLGITGMCFGNMGHLVNPGAGPGGITVDAHDNSGIVLDPYVAGVSDDIPTLPAEPWDNGGNHGYSWPGGGVKARFPNLHQPNAFLAENTINGVIPWGYGGLATITDNQYASASSLNRCVYEGNTTLYSETARFPLDKGDGITFPDGNSIRFKTTIPADSELNQERVFGYGQRPRFWITEAGLISGENILVQSPDARTAGAMDPSTTGISNINGANLMATGVIGGAPYDSLPKDYFTRLRDPATATWFTDPATGQLDSSNNNVFNLCARKVFGVVSKTSSISLSWLWTISFG